MAERYPEQERETRGNGADRGEERGRPEEGREERRARDWHEEEEEGRFHRAARERRYDEHPGEDRADRAWTSTRPGGGGRDFARNFDRATFEQREGDRFEHERRGFEDFGTPSLSSGRELREHYDDRDFAGRDDRVAGRSGMSYRPDRMETPPSAYHPPEEDWERLHYRGDHVHLHGHRRGRLWEREPHEAQDIMTRNPRAVYRDATLREVARIMRDENCGIVPVVDRSNRLQGVVTDRDMVMRTFDRDRPWVQIRVDEVMTTDVHAVRPQDPVHDVIQLMGRYQVRRVPVVDRFDRLVGMISMADVANRAHEDVELQHALDRISRRRSFWTRLWS